MKKIIILIFITVLVSIHQLYSQDSKAMYGEKTVNLGIKVSPLMTWMVTPSEGYSSTAGTGIYGGLTVDFRFAKNCFIATGLQYSYLTHHISYPDKIFAGSFLRGETHSDLRMSYIELPLAFKIKTSALNKLRGYGEIGFDFGVRISANAKNTFEDEHRTIESERLNISGLMTRFKAGGIIGGGVEYYFRPSLGLQFGLLYHIGFTNIMQGYNSLHPTVRNSLYPQVLELSIGFIFL